MQFGSEISLREIPLKWEYQASVGYSIILSLFIEN